MNINIARISSRRIIATTAFCHLIVSFMLVSTWIRSADCHQEIDLSKWIDQNITVFPLELTFKVPTGRAEDFGNPSVASDANLDRDPREPQRAVSLFNHTWSYDR